MTRLSLFTTFVPIVLGYEAGVLPASPAPTLWETYGPVKPLARPTPWQDRLPPPTLWEVENLQGLDPQVTKVARAADECYMFPLDIVIVQDSTASFDDDFQEMLNVQLDAMYRGIEERHPGSRYGLVSFQDKPIWTLGDTSNYCLDFNVPLTTDLDAIRTGYKRLASYGGGDMQENQFGALFATAYSQAPGWAAPADGMTRLIILITDAHPHFADDNLNKYGLKPFNNTWSVEDADKVCREEYYPSPEQVRDTLARTQTQVAFLFSEGGFDNNLTTRSWEWFNSFIGQTPSYLGNLYDGSQNFWPTLSAIIRAIESYECPDSSTPPPECHAGRIVKEEIVKGVRVLVLADDDGSDQPLTNEEALDVCRP